MELFFHIVEGVPQIEVLVTIAPMECVCPVIMFFPYVMRATIFLDTDILIVLDVGSGIDVFRHMKVRS